MKELVALTVKQPWATLMVTPDPNHPGQAYKPLENRAWETSYRGLVLIHTGKQKDDEALEMINASKRDFPKSYPRGAIVGMASLVACRRPTGEDPAALLEECDALFGRVYHLGHTRERLPSWLLRGHIWLWEFRDPIRFQNRIPCQGKLWLWKLDRPLHAEVEKQIALAKKQANQ